MRLGAVTCIVIPGHVSTKEKSVCGESACLFISMFFDILKNILAEQEMRPLSSHRREREKTPAAREGVQGTGGRPQLTCSPDGP